MSEDIRQWFIYVLRDPRTNEVRYVGWTYDPAKRLRYHLYDATKGGTYKANWITQLRSLGLIPSMEIIDEGHGVGWGEAERRHIAAYRAIGARLTNMTDGGDGNPGWVPSEATRKKMRRRTPEASERLRERNRSRIITDEERERRRQRVLGTKRPPEVGDKIRAALTGRKHTGQAKKNIKQANVSRGYKVRRVEDGKIFPTIRRAARVMHSNDASLRQAIKSGTWWRGYHWELVAE